jgi:hypothetical protein
MLEEEFIVWNSSLGIRDFATIGESQDNNGVTLIWLDEPYEMVGPLNLEILLKDGQTDFEACSILTQEYWQENQNRLKQKSYQKQQDMYEEIRNYNISKQKQSHSKEIECRKLLYLPLEGKLKSDMIKTAYRKIAKKEHPDTGGTQEGFVKLTEAKECLLLLCC